MTNRVWVYTICYNESHFVKNFLAAYAQAERIVAYDNQSTDNTVELLSQDPRVEVRINDSGNEIRDDIYLRIKNNAWKEARGLADWVIVVDFDEIFCRAWLNNGNAELSLDLTEPFEKGHTIIKPYGYNMISLDAPLGAEGHPLQYCQNGVYHWPMEKPCCFRPDKIQEINYYPGGHGIEPIGEVSIFNHPVYKLLHFKMWNLQHYLDRMALCASRMSAVNKSQGWGEHYLWPAERHKKTYLEAHAASKPLFFIMRTDKIY